MRKSTIIRSNKFYEISKEERTATFIGCQCFKDCTCRDEFKPYDFHYYLVKNFVGNKKDKSYQTLNEANERCNFIISRWGDEKL